MPPRPWYIVLGRAIIIAGALVAGAEVGRTPAGQEFLERVQKHLAAEGIGSGALLIMAARKWPKKLPRTAQDWWDWAGETLRTPFQMLASAESKQKK